LLEYLSTSFIINFLALNDYLETSCMTMIFVNILN
jgi:hypothetical protein